MKRVALILSLLFSHLAMSADVIEQVSLIRSENIVGSDRTDAKSRTVSPKPIHARAKDRLILDAGKSGRYVISVEKARRSQFGNTIIHGKTSAGGDSLMVISSNGSITGNFHQYEGKVMVTTGKDSVITAWREGIDAIALPICNGSSTPEAEDTAFVNMAGNAFLSATHLSRGRISRAYRVEMKK